MNAPDFVKASDLIAQDGPFRGEWPDVDIHTLQYNTIQQQLDLPSRQASAQYIMR